MALGRVAPTARASRATTSARSTVPARAPWACPMQTGALAALQRAAGAHHLLSGASDSGTQVPCMLLLAPACYAVCACSFRGCRCSAKEKCSNRLCPCLAGKVCTLRVRVMAASADALGNQASRVLLLSLLDLLSSHTSMPCCSRALPSRLPPAAGRECDPDLCRCAMHVDARNMTGHVACTCHSAACVPPCLVWHA